MKTHSSSDVTIIIVAHNEGLASYKTWLSLNYALEKLKEEGISWEITIIANHTDSATARGLAIFEDNQVPCISCGNLSLGATINKVVNASRSKYIMLLRASDLISPNFIYGAIESDIESESIIWHPEAIVEFGTDVWKNLIWIF